MSYTSPYSAHPAASTSTAKSSPASATSSLPYTLSRRDSTCSTYSCGSWSCGSDAGSSSEDEVATPDCSPELVPADSVSRKGKGKASPGAFDLSASFSEFALDDISEDWSIPVVPVSPAAATVPLLPLPSLPPPASTASSASTSSSSSTSPTSSRAFAHPRPLPDSPPTRAVEAEEESRGRNRYPRLLWRSEVDMDSLIVLRDYHERAVGGPLPILRKGMSEREVRRWSRRIDDAGL